MTAPVEKTTTYATVTDDLPAAWTFVMARVDDVGTDPRITISPIWWNDHDGEGDRRRFEVSVSGMTEET